MACLTRIFKFLDEAELDDDLTAENVDEDLTWDREGDFEIEFKDVSFSYVKDQPVIKNVSFKIKAGSSCAIVGPTGCGKTTLASALAHDLDIPYRLFNASTGNKKQMDQIIAEAKMSDGLFVIIDEVHRMNKDKQDHLLPHIESGLLIIAGCTTANPYHSINPAIRSRCQILKVKPLKEEDVIEGLKRGAQSEKGLNNEFEIDEDVYRFIAKMSSGDIRYAYNALETASIIVDDGHITLKEAKRALPHANAQFDKD
jgi:putative ATPase